MRYVTGEINFGAVIERKLTVIMREKKCSREEAVIFCVEKVSTPIRAHDNEEH